MGGKHPPGYMRAYYERNRDKLLARSRAHKAADPARARASVNHWMKSAKGLAWKATLYSRYPALFKANAAKRRAAELQRFPSWLTPIDKNLILEHYDVSKARDMQTGLAHDVDHIVPLRGEHVSGLHVPWNLQVLTREANRAKGRNYGYF